MFVGGTGVETNLIVRGEGSEKESGSKKKEN